MQLGHPRILGKAIIHVPLHTVDDSTLKAIGEVLKAGGHTDGDLIAFAAGKAHNSLIWVGLMPDTEVGQMSESISMEPVVELLEHLSRLEAPGDDVLKGVHAMLSLDKTADACRSSFMGNGRPKQPWFRAAFEQSAQGSRRRWGASRLTI